MLDNRLKKIAELVSGDGIAVDVGTDHAYLAVELVKSGKCKNVIASDVKEGPLDSARSTVEKYGVQDKVELILSDGLENVSLEGVSDIVIAGMGGETILEIMAKVSTDGRADEDIHWILQPMTKPEVLRKGLYAYGYALKEEFIVEEGEKLYTVMTADYDPNYLCDLTEAESMIGHFDREAPLTKKYYGREAERCRKVAENLKKAGKDTEAQHFTALASKIENGISDVNVNEIISFLDSRYPFGLQEKWDNSGYLVEYPLDECKTVILALDITNEVVEEAFKKSAELIISHHPVIFEPRKRITCNDPVYKLIECCIGAVCLHTNLDIANGGTNGVILKKLSEKLEISGEPEPFEELSDGCSLGWIIDLKEKISIERLGEICKGIFNCEYIRATNSSNKMLSRIAFCSGSGGSMLNEAIDKNCDILVTGDVKHDVWIDALNRGISVMDCGHFHTENIVLWELRRALEERFPQLDVEIAEQSVDPCMYL